MDKKRHPHCALKSGRAKPTAAVSMSAGATRRRAKNTASQPKHLSAACRKCWRRCRMGYLPKPLHIAGSTRTPSTPMMISRPGSPRAMLKNRRSMVVLRLRIGAITPAARSALPQSWVSPFALYLLTAKLLGQASVCTAARPLPAAWSLPKLTSPSF